MFIRDLSKEIIKKKELSTLDIDFVISRTKHILEQNPKTQARMQTCKDFNQFKKTTLCKELIKDVRTHLREIYGVFQNNPKKQEKLMQELIASDDMKNKMRLAIDLLQTHQSTKERSIHYELIYKTLFNHIDNIKTIFDVGCGINPLSLIYLPQKPYIYATDIATADMNMLQKLLNSLEIPATCFATDITQISSKELQEKTKNTTFDLCLMFKLLDTLESNKKYSSKQVIQNINARYFLLSFPKFSLGGKRDIIKTKRAWVQRLIASLPQMTLIHEFEVPNEIFYLLKQHPISHL